MWTNSRKSGKASATDVDPEGRSVLVTGASSGIGYLIAQLLADRGFHVFAGGRKRVDVEDLSRHRNITGIHLDVTSTDDIAAAVELVGAHSRPLFGLVNNAGIINCAPLSEVDEEEVIRMFDVNVFGAYRVTRAFAPMLIESQGRIANIGSVSGFFSTSFNGLYGMTKHALEAYSDSLSAELKDLGVAVSSIVPSSFNSRLGKNMLARMRKGRHGAENSRFRDQLHRRIAFFEQDFSGKLEEPHKVAEAVYDVMTSTGPSGRYLVVSGKRDSWQYRLRVMAKALRMNARHSSG